MQVTSRKDGRMCDKCILDAQSVLSGVLARSSVMDPGDCVLEWPLSGLSCAGLRMQCCRMHHVGGRQRSDLRNPSRTERLEQGQQRIKG